MPLPRPQGEVSAWRRHLSIPSACEAHQAPPAPESPPVWGSDSAASLPGRFAASGPEGSSGDGRVTDGRAKEYDCRGSMFGFALAPIGRPRMRLMAALALLAALLAPASGLAATANNGPRIATRPAHPSAHCKRGEGWVLVKLATGRKVWRCLKVD